MLNRVKLLIISLILPSMSFASAVYNLPSFARDPVEKAINFLTDGVSIAAIIAGIAIAGITIVHEGVSHGVKFGAKIVLGGGIAAGAASVCSWLFGATFF